MIWLGVVMSIRLQRTVLPTYESAAESVVTDLYQYYPDNLVITWDGSQLDLSPAEPIMVDWPLEIGTTAEKLPETFIRVDLDETNFTESSLLAVNRDTLFINDLQGNWNSTPLSVVLGSQTAELRKENLPDMIEQIRTYVRAVFSVINLAAYLVVPIILIITRLWIGLLESILAFLILKLNGAKLGFLKTFQLGLHIMVIAEIVVQVADWLYPTHQVPLFTLAFWLVFFYIFWQNRRTWTQSLA